MIPPVRSWRVRFFDGKTLLVDVVVETINKRFARWMANEQNGYPAIRSDRVAVSLVRFPVGPSLAAKCARTK
jgi:hypothetical protein